MAIAREAFAITDNIWGTSITIDKPSGTAENDIMVAYITSGGASSITPPTGWTQIASTNHVFSYQWFYYKVAGASEPTTYTWSWTGDNAVRGGIIRYSGVNTATVEDVAESTNSGNSASPVGTGITTVTDGAMLVMCLVTDASNGQSAAPSGMSEIFDMSRMIVNDGSQETAGSSGDKTSTIPSSTFWGTILWAMRPAVAATTSRPVFRRKNYTWKRVF